jgi:hypothetical protein
MKKIFILFVLAGLMAGCAVDDAGQGAGAVRDTGVSGNNAGMSVGGPETGRSGPGVRSPAGRGIGGRGDGVR